MSHYRHAEEQRPTTVGHMRTNCTRLLAACFSNFLLSVISILLQFSVLKNHFREKSGSLSLIPHSNAHIRMKRFANRENGKSANQSKVYTPKTRQNRPQLMALINKIINFGVCAFGYVGHFGRATVMQKNSATSPF